MAKQSANDSSAVQKFAINYVHACCCCWWANWSEQAGFSALVHRKRPPGAVIYVQSLAKNREPCSGGKIGSVNVRAGSYSDTSGMVVFTRSELAKGCGCEEKSIPDISQFLTRLMIYPNKGSLTLNCNLGCGSSNVSRNTDHGFYRILGHFE